jgi:hypothetical protein
MGQGPELILESLNKHWIKSRRELPQALVELPTLQEMIRLQDSQDASEQDSQDTWNLGDTLTIEQLEFNIQEPL